MNIERFAYKFAFVWLCFRIAANIVSITWQGLVEVVRTGWRALLALLPFALLAGVAWWKWEWILQRI